MEIAIAVGITLASVILLALLAGGAFFFFRAVNRFVSASEANKSLATEMSKAVEALSAMPKIYDGHLRVAQANVKAIGLLQVSVDRFKSSLFPTQASQEMPVVSEARESDADRLYSVMQLLNENPGMRLDDARQRVDDEEARMASVPSLGME